MVIQHNLSALTANRNRVIIENKMAKVLEKLSTAKRINTAADDASGLSVTEKMRGQINGLQRSIFNANDAISLIQTAEGGLVESHNILERMMKLAVSAANGTFDNTVDRAVLEKEFDYLQSELNTIAQNTNFNNIKPLDGSLAKPATSSNAAAKMMSATTVEGKNNFLQYEKWKATKSTYSFEKKKDGIEIQLDHNGVSSNNIKIYIDDMSSKGLKLDKASLEGVAKAFETIELVKNAINMVSSTRADLGAAQNKIGFAIDFMGVNRQNLVDSSSRISDADMAEEAMKFAKLLILGESSKAALAQANVQPVQVLGIISKATEKPEQNAQNEPKPKPKPEFQPKEPIKQAPVKKPTFEPKQAKKAENNHENSLDF